MKNILAIDLGGTSAKCGFVVGGKLIHSFKVSTIKNKIVENLFEQTKQEADKNNFNLASLDAIGFASPGLVDSNDGVVVFAANLDWNDYNLKLELQNKFSCKNIFILNDAKAATYGSWKKDFDKSIPSMMLITLGTGIGGGVIVKNKLISGDNTKLPSEPGHGGGFQNRRMCPCGLKGCIEPIASGSGMEWLLKEKAKTSDGELGKLFQESADFKLEDVKKLFDNNNNEVVECISESMNVLAKVISVITHTFDLGAIVIAGGPTNLGSKLLDILKVELKNYLLPVFYKKINILFSSNKGDTGLNGIIEYVNDMMEENKNDN